jgi:hypothetical protein
VLCLGDRTTLPLVREPKLHSAPVEPGLSPAFSSDVRETLRAAADAGLKSLPRRGAEIGGLLTTSSPPSSAPFIDHAELVTTEHRYGPGYRLSPQDIGLLRSKAEEIRASEGRRLTGYFRSCTSDRFTLSTDDLAVVRDELPECRPLLIVKPFPDGHAMARVFQPLGGEWSQTDEFELVRAIPLAPALDLRSTPPNPPKPSASANAMRHGTLAPVIRTSQPPVLRREQLP